MYRSTEDNQRPERTDSEKRMDYVNVAAGVLRANAPYVEGGDKFIPIEATDVIEIADYIERGPSCNWLRNSAPVINEEATK